MSTMLLSVLMEVDQWKLGLAALPLGLVQWVEQEDKLHFFVTDKKGRVKCADAQASRNGRT